MTLATPSIDFAAVLASTVHDMKNSLCMLIQSTELIQQESRQLSEPARDELARLNYEANRLNSNLLQLLSLYRMERQRLPVQIDQHYIADIVEEILLKNQFYIEQRNFTIHVEQPEQLNWFFDYDLMLNMLNDAVANALRYGDKEILLRFSQHADTLLIEVHDDGPGFPVFMLNSDEIDMNTPDLTGNHTGLGIFFAKLIAKAHTNKGQSGIVELANASRYGGGIFRVTLP
ncbi:sensor histidine kinase [Rheinheimera maricola]|uniref:HAMP domain-containing histidine kinase n=1 Tax=Rheinheimera maricola TaxID=2793282 RepID=A0ABS7X3M8_9GAMM|nr:HAMP domain-containing sensor histidine kinase [Rheinheimera maricola]MBZ9610173.1 HAMP domain-containing histidine kinase [Rheinheimera maricola]